MSTIVAWLSGILGEYVPVTYQTTKVIDGQEVIEDIVAQGFAGVDWQYVICGLLLLITIYSTFRLLGVLLESIGGRR